MAEAQATIEDRRHVVGILVAHLISDQKLAIFTIHLTSESLGMMGVDAGGRDVTDARLAHIAGLRGLQHRTAAMSAITDAGLGHLAGSIVLRALNPGMKSQLTDGGLVHLAGLTALKQLELRPDHKTGDGPVHLKHRTNLTSLRIIELDTSHLTDAGMERLGAFTQLQTVWLTRHEWTKPTLPPTGLGELRRALPHCRIVVDDDD